jgi:hypothetical protein
MRSKVLRGWLELELVPKALGRTTCRSTGDPGREGMEGAKVETVFCSTRALIELKTGKWISTLWHNKLRLAEH